MKTVWNELKGESDERTEKIFFIYGKAQISLLDDSDNDIDCGVCFDNFVFVY